MRLHANRSSVERVALLFSPPMAGAAPTSPGFHRRHVPRQRSSCWCCGGGGDGAAVTVAARAAQQTARTAAQIPASADGGRALVHVADSKRRVDAKIRRGAQKCEGARRRGERTGDLGKETKQVPTPETPETTDERRETAQAAGDAGLP